MADEEVSIQGAAPSLASRRPSNHTNSIVAPQATARPLGGSIGSISYPRLPVTCAVNRRPLTEDDHGAVAIDARCQQIARRALGPLKFPEPDVYLEPSDDVVLRIRGEEHQINGV